MDEDIKRENITFRIKQLLQRNSIKLWLPPYYQQTQDTSDLEFNDEIVSLAEQYRVIVNADFQLCAEILLELQDKSLQKLKEREIFHTEGLATISVKVSGQNVPEFSIHSRLSDCVEIIRQSIAERIDILAERLKLISNGKILKCELSLEQQAVKHGNTVLVIVLPAMTDDTSVTNSVDNVDEKVLQDTMKDLEFLTHKAKRKNILSVTDQSGHFLNIPESQRQHLLYGMTLHEKGRSAFKRGSYSLALVFYLEANNEFKLSNCDLLEKADNYALLNLDIVWCYLHLKSVHYLHDAEKRLQICEESFRKSYGTNLERLKALKGSSGNESVLLVRLHLLQAILHHLLNRNEIAREKFNQVESELNELRVDNEKMIYLITQLNCTPKEARLGLRASHNNQNAAYEFILQERELKKRIKAVEKIKKMADYCICEDGNAVNAEKVKQLVEMDYSQLLAMSGLKNSNNDLDSAIVWISNFIENLKNLYPNLVADVITTIDINVQSYRMIYHFHNYKLDEACIADIMAASVGTKQATDIFPNANLNISNLSVGTPASILSPDTSPVSLFSQPIPSTSSSIAALGAITSNLLSTFDQEKEENNALERISKDVNDTTDDYLDNTLESEEKLFIMYKSLLN